MNSLESEEDKKLFLKTLEGCQKYALAIIVAVVALISQIRY
jgi:hypothetical protein